MCADLPALETSCRRCPTKLIPDPCTPYSLVVMSRATTFTFFNSPCSYHPGWTRGFDLQLERIASDTAVRSIHTMQTVHDPFIPDSSILGVSKPCFDRRGTGEAGYLHDILHRIPIPLESLPRHIVLKKPRPQIHPFDDHDSLSSDRILDEIWGRAGK